MRKFLEVLRTFRSGYAHAPLFLAALMALAGCSSGNPTVAEENRILVLPFDCSILPSENAETSVMLQNMLAGRVVYWLQSAGIPAEQYVLDGAARAAQARDYAALLPASRSPGRELLAGALGASPPRISGGASLEPGADAPADAPAADSRQYGGAAVDAPLPKDIRQRALDEARERGFDYVVAGSIAMVRTEVSPTVTMAGAERATVRAELNSAFQLIYVKKGNVTKAGAADGRDALSVTMRSGRHLDDYQLVSALDKALRRAVNAAALRTAGVLAGRDLGVVSSELELEEERVYYQDSPGKRLRPEKPEK